MGRSVHSVDICISILCATCRTGDRPMFKQVVLTVYLRPGRKLHAIDSVFVRHRTCHCISVGRNIRYGHIGNPRCVCICANGNRSASQQNVCTAADINGIYLNILTSRQASVHLNRFFIAVIIATAIGIMNIGSYFICRNLITDSSDIDMNLQCRIQVIFIECPSG